MTGRTQVWTEPQTIDAVLASIRDKRARRIRLGLIRPTIRKIDIVCENEKPEPIPVDRPDRPMPAFDALAIPQKLKLIATIVARYYGLTFDEIHSERRETFYVVPRQIAQYIQRKHILVSWPRIGRNWHHDHTTIMHSCRKISRQVQEDARLSADIENLERQMGIYHDMGQSVGLE